MATQVLFNRLIPATAGSRANTGVRAGKVNRDERFRVRRVPNESIYFFTKGIDNSRLVREKDPRTAGTNWRMMLATLGGAALLILVLLPSAYSLIAGHELQELRTRREQLLTERRNLEVEEAKILTPAKLEEYAETQKLVDPGGKVVYLPGEKTGTEARLRAGRH